MIRVPAEARDFLYSKVSRLAMESNSIPVQWVLETLTPGEATRM
jgi:hypothetical protein